ncbi:MAG TPA: protein kinase [Caldimonas sp.]|nr:protein kinase [Caldimonas sp.]
MSTADDPDDEKTLSGPPPGAARSGARDDAETGIHAERRRGRAAAELQPGHTLPLGTRLRDYEITGLIGEGGFGIVYLAWDHSLQRKVAIKEYMPASMAARVNGSSAIVVKSERHLDTFRAGLKSFVNEARLLARFDHPSLVKVYRFWEENGTAYMVMPYYEGPTLKAALAELGRPPTEDELRAWLKPLLDALAVMHASQCYHRDISPDNILLTPRGPLLLDFGAARRVIGDMTHAITVVLKPGYAPIEQYGEVATMAQGAWTDLYALACVVYYAIAGKTPTSSVERLMDDRVEPLAVRAAGRYSDAFLRAIDAALAVRPADRPQTEREFRALLDAGLPARSGDDARDSAFTPYATAPGALTTPSAFAPDDLSPRFEPTATRTAAATVPDGADARSSEAPSSEMAPSGEALAWGEAPTEIDRPTASEPSIAATSSGFMASTAPSLPPATTGSSAALATTPPIAPTPRRPSTDPAIPAARNPAATVLIGSAVVAVIATVGMFAWLQQRGPAAGSAGPAASAVTAQPASSVAATSLPPAASAPAAAVVSESPRAVEPPASDATAGAAPQLPVEAPAQRPVERPSEQPLAEAPPADRDAPSAVTTAPLRTPRPRRESPALGRVDNATAVKPAPPHPPVVSSRCSDILQKASLEPLTATEAAYLKRECR